MNKLAYVLRGIFLQLRVMGVAVFNAIEIGGGSRVGSLFYGTSDNMVAGEITIPCAIISPNAVIILTAVTGSNTGSLSYSNIIENESFDVTSSDAFDTNKVTWVVINP